MKPFLAQVLLRSMAIALLLSPVATQRPGAEDAMVTAVVNDDPSCSCNCCQVVERLPSELVVQQDGSELKHKCANPVRAADDEAVIPECPSICTTDEGHLDYNAFCSQGCFPTTATVGTECMAIPESALQSIDMGGAGVASPMTGGVAVVGASANEPSAADWQAEMEEERSDRIAAEFAAAAEAEKSGAEKKGANEVVFDLRTLSAARLRTEAAASSASVSASAEQVRGAGANIKRNAALLGRLRGAVPAAESELSAAASMAEANQTLAAEAASATKQVSMQAEKDAPQMLANIRNLAIQEIHMQAAVAAQAAARAYARRVAWDKPASYGRVVAYKAGEPFQVESSAAIARESQYRATAANYEGQAAAAVAQSDAISNQVGALESQGDKMGVMMGREQAEQLLKQSHYVEAQAVEASALADKSHAAALEWATASSAAVAAASQRYTLAHRTTPAPMGMTTPAFGAFTTTTAGLIASLR